MEELLLRSINLLIAILIIWQAIRNLKQRWNMADKIKANKIIIYKVEYTDGESTQVFADKSKTAQEIAEKMRPDAKVKSTTNKNK
mgnify:CR=1 FL=1